MDMKTVIEQTRRLQNEGGDSVKKSGKRTLEKEIGELTIEDIERSLQTIRSGLATVTEGPDSALEKFKQIEAELNDLPEAKTLAKDFQEEFKDLTQTAAMLKQDEQLEQEIQKGKAKMEIFSEPDDREKTPAQKKAS